MPLSFCLAQNDGCGDANAVNASMVQGETINYQWAFQNPDGSAMNLTGYYFQVGINFAPAVFYNSSGNGLTVNASAGTVTWSVADTVTANYVVGEFPYQFFGQDSAGTRNLDFSGVFNVNQSFTPLSA